MRRMDREAPQWQSSSRTTRWWEWLLILLLLGLAGGARAAPVYKCNGASGEIAYQGIPCAEPAGGSVVEIAPAPPYAKSPEYAVERVPEAPARAARTPRRGAAVEATSFECRAADGQVFYRHSTCPHSVAGTTGGASSARGSRGNRSAGGSVAVSSRHIPRDEACQAIHTAGSIGRAGHQYDDTVSTYERNLGHDPCR